MKIRHALPEDVEGWAALRHALWPHAPLEELLEDARALMASPDDARVVLVDDGGAIVGFAEARLHRGDAAPYVHVEGWYVAPEHRRQGHGKDLVGAIENWCLHRSIRTLTSDTTPKYPLSPSAHEHAGFRKLADVHIFVKEPGPR